MKEIATAIELGNKIKFTHLAVGDGNGSLPEINDEMTSLVNEVWRGPVDGVTVGENKNEWVMLTAYIPASEGGFEIREIGAYDDKGQLLAVGTYPVIWKPSEFDGAVTELTIRMAIGISNTEAVELYFDDSAQYVTMSELKDIIDANIQNKASKSIETQGRGDTEHTRQINASLASRSSGVASQVNASRNSNADAGRSQVNASDTAQADGIMSQVNASQKSTASHQNSVILSSLGAKTRKDYTIMGGYGDSNFGDEADTTFEIDVKSGEAYYKKDVYTDTDRLSDVSGEGVEKIYTQNNRVFLSRV